MFEITKGAIIEGFETKKGINIRLAKNYSKFVQLSPSQNALLDIFGVESVACEAIEKAKKSTGEMYTCLEVSIQDYKTTVYLDNAEQYLLSINS